MKVRNAIGGLMALLAVPAFGDIQTCRPDEVPAVSPVMQLGTIWNNPTPEVPYPTIWTTYDIDGDGDEDMRFIHLYEPISEYMGYTTLIGWMRDWNENDKYEDRERRMVEYPRD